MNDAERNKLLEAQQQELRALEEKMMRLEERSRDIQNEIATTRALISAYRTILQHAGGGVQLAAMARLIPEPARSAAPVTHVDIGGGRQPGNRNPDLPPRALRFADMSVEKAAVILAKEWGTPHHADDYAMQIWQIGSKTNLHSVKRTLNSALARLAKKGGLEKRGRNTFSPILKKEE